MSLVTDVMWFVESQVNSVLSFIANGYNLPLQKLQGDWAPPFSTRLSGIVWVTRSVSYDGLIGRLNNDDDNAKENVT